MVRALMEAHLRGWTRAFMDWALHSEGSTRTSALIRIGLATILWTRWANELLPFNHLADGRWPLCVAFFVATSLLLVGLWTKVSAPLVAVIALWLVYYVGYVQGEGNYSNLSATLLAWAIVWLACTPCGASYSVDRWLALRRADQSGQDPPEERGALWGLRLMSLQVAALQLWTAMAWCNRGFLSGDRLAQYVMKYYTGSSPIDEGVSGLILMVAAWVIVALEFALTVGLFFKRTRNWLVLIGLILYGAFYLGLDVSTFSVTLWVMYLAFYNADEVHRLIDYLSGYTRPMPISAGAEPVKEANSAPKHSAGEQMGSPASSPPTSRPRYSTTTSPPSP
jgi:hypothetical protein